MPHNLKGIYIMIINFEKMGDNETSKVCELIDKAIKLEWDHNYSEVGVNENNGNVYIYNEDEPYTLFIDLANDLMACKTDYDTGEEDIIEVGSMSRHDLEKWGNQPILKVI